MPGIRFDLTTAGRQQLLGRIFRCWSADCVVSLVIQSMTVPVSLRPTREEFSAFVRKTEPKLLQALVANYGTVDGREATVDALSWAWEHWCRLEGVTNQVGCLHRVGQTATRRFVSRQRPLVREVPAANRLPDLDPGLVHALGRLSQHQRTVVTTGATTYLQGTSGGVTRRHPVGVRAQSKLEYGPDRSTDSELELGGHGAPPTHVRLQRRCRNPDHSRQRRPHRIRCTHLDGQIATKAQLRRPR